MQIVCIWSGHCHSLHLQTDFLIWSDMFSVSELPVWKMWNNQRIRDSQGIDEESGEGRANCVSLDNC